jgi:hypothetical protein
LRDTLFVAAQRFQLARRRIADFIKFGQFGTQLVEGNKIPGGHLLIARPLAVYLSQLVCPEPCLLVRVARFSTPLDFDCRIKVGAQLFGVQQ